MLHLKNSSFHSRGKSFSFALNGLYLLVRQEPNIRIHAAATLVAIIAGIARSLSRWQWVAMLFAIGMVWMAEAINTCIERLCDMCCDNKWHPTVKIIKDIAAAAVLIASVASLCIGIIIFF